jgi:uncharacterized protein (DUF2236 family)
MSLRLVPPLPSGMPGDPGLTGPGSLTWRIARERVAPLGGPSALLLQLAHPLAAAGVAEGHYRVAMVRCRPAADPSVALSAQM